MTPNTLPRPLYAAAGAGDAVAEQLRKLAGQAPVLQQQLQSRVAELPAELRQIRRELPRGLQTLAADLPSYAAQLQTRARGIDTGAVTEVVRKNVQTAQDVYAGLVARGQKMVDRDAAAGIAPADAAPTAAPAALGTAPAAAGTQTAVKTAARTTVRKTATRSATRQGTEQS